MAGGGRVMAGRFRNAYSRHTMTIGGSHSSLLIQGGTLVTENGRRSADLLIRDGKIEKIGEKLKCTGDCRTLDAAGLWVLPGGV